MRKFPRLFFMLLLTAALLTAPACFVRAQSGAAVSGFVYIDRDLNGRYDSSEYLLAGAEILLMQGRDALALQVGSVLTGADGRYAFGGLPAGDYHLKVMLGKDYTAGPFSRGGSLALPSNTGSSRTLPFTLAQDEQSRDKVLIGAMPVKQTGFVRVIAFGDENANGGRFSSEPFLRGVRAELLFQVDGVDYPVASALSDKEGVATMSGIAPGTYVLSAVLPSPYIVGPLGSRISLFYNAVLPSGESSGRSAPFLLPAGGSVGMGIGGVKTGSAQGRVFEDSNFNGALDAGEPGLPGLDVTLRHKTLGIQKVARSDANGNYGFVNLNGGEYTLSVTLPDDRMFTRQGATLLSSDTSRSASTAVSIAVEKTLGLAPIGVIPNTSLSLLAFHDSNVNGLLDAGEPPFAGASLEVLSGGKAVARAETDAAGEALIPLLRGGDLQVRLSLPDGQIFSISGGEGGNAFFDRQARSRITIPYTLAPAAGGRLLAAVTLPALMSGTLYEDMNSNGAHDEAERPLPGFQAQALDTRGEVAAQAETDAQGTFQLSPLIPGDYTLRILLQSPYIFSKAPGGSADRVNRIVSQTADYGDSDIMSLAPGGSLTTMDAAIFRSGVVEGDVLLGDEGDAFAGLQGGLPGVVVELLDADDRPVSAYTVATSDARGHFLLKGALPGSYKLRYTLPAEAAFAKPFSDEASYIGPLFAVAAADELQAETLFAVKTASFGGTVYLDVNVDGGMDAGDTPIAGAELSLVGEAPSGGAQALSLGDGGFLMRGLRPGSYTLKVVLPEGKLISFDERSPLSPAAENSSSVRVDLGMGMASLNNSIAAVNTHRLSGRVFLDNDLDSAAEAGEPGFPVELRLRHDLSKVVFTATADASGAYQIPALFPGEYSLGMTLPDDMVMLSAQSAHAGTDWTLPLLLSSAGAASREDIGLVRFGSLSGALWNMDGSDRDVAGIPLRLMQGARVVAEASTDAAGAYQFPGLYPGQYSLQVSLPEGFRFARLIDSQMTRFSLITQDGATVTGEQGLSLPFNLAMAEHRGGQDIGMGRTGKLGDFAWLDSDGDGMQDAGEPGVPGIGITLYQFGQVAAQTVTDAYGRYQFSALFPGSYRLEVTLPPELKATRHQTEFSLVASILPETAGTVLTVDGVLVPSGGRNLNADLGFVPVREGELPASMNELPVKDWTPLVPGEPQRIR
ncbi:MAG: SdrD B-like domain-containing protein [Christensenellales bacterium]